MLAELVQFEASAPRCSYSDQPVPPGGVPRALRMTAESGGLDAVAELYNEALRYASEGHYRMARERVQVLLALAPDDGEAVLLHAKILVAGQRWKEALAALDEAQSCGQTVAPVLRRTVEDHLRADLESEEEQRAARMAREQGEIKALRQEARRLRSENAQLVGRSRELELEIKKWAWTAAAVSSFAIVFIVGNLIFGGGSAEAHPRATANRTVQDPPAMMATVSEDEGVAASPVAPPPVTVADAAAMALAKAPGLDGSQLELIVDGSTARLTGSVPTFRHRKDAEGVLITVSGIESVEASDVEIVARTRGATHTVKGGDNLSAIAYTYYGESVLSKRILKANNAVLKGKPNLHIGQELVIPPVE